MLDDTFYLYARYKGSDAARYYTNNKNYLLLVKVGRFKSKRVKIAEVEADNKQPKEGSERHYAAKEVFEQSWKVIRDLSQEM